MPKKKKSEDEEEIQEESEEDEDLGLEEDIEDSEQEIQEDQLSHFLQTGTTRPSLERQETREMATPRIVATPSMLAREGEEPGSSVDYGVDEKKEKSPQEEYALATETAYDLPSAITSQERVDIATMGRERASIGQQASFQEAAELTQSRGKLEREYTAITPGEFQSPEERSTLAFQQQRKTYEENI